MLRGERLAITTGSMNRLQHLRLALETWTKLPEPDKIIIVDWGSSDPLHSALSSFTDERITFVRAEQTTWQNSRCHNLEFSAASRLECDLVLRLDNDTLVDPSFFDHHPIDDTSFYAVNCHTVPREVDDKRNLCGTVFVATRHWRRVNGYNERLTRYGYEDEDFYGRLSSQRLAWRECQLEDLEHIPHSNESRLANLPASSTLSSVSLEVAKQFNITLSKQISVERPWSPDDHITPWTISPSNNSDRLLIASM